MFFSFDTPESFYWAGFIAADGCIFKNQLKINLAEKDLEHLQKFACATNFNGMIESVKWKVSSGFLTSITSKQIIKDLERFNVVPRKTFVYAFPEWLVEHPLVNHFMRGYFDGDGSVWFTLPESNTTNILNFEILGTQAFVKSYADILMKMCNASLYIRQKKNIWCGRFGGNQVAKRVRKFLYKDANENILLSRKRDRFFDPEVDTNRRHRKIIGTSLKDGTQIAFNSIAEAVKIGFDRHIIDCCKGNRKHNKGYAWEYVK